MESSGCWLLQEHRQSGNSVSGPGEPRIALLLLLLPSSAAVMSCRTELVAHVGKISACRHLVLIACSCSPLEAR